MAIFELFDEYSNIFLLLYRPGASAEQMIWFVVRRRLRKSAQGGQVRRRDAAHRKERLIVCCMCASMLAFDGAGLCLLTSPFDCD